MIIHKGATGLAYEISPMYRGKPILGWRTVYEMNTTAESAYSPGVERLRVGLKLGEEPYFAAFKR